MKSIYEKRNKPMGRVSTTLLATLFCLASAYPTPGQTTSPNPLRTIIPVQFDASTGDITVGSKTYQGANPGFHVLALRRQPNNQHLDAPDVVLDKAFTDGSSAFNALVAIRTGSPDALLMVNAVGNYGFTLADKVGTISGFPALLSVGWYLGTFGAYPDLAGIGSTIPFIFVGVGGGNAQTALQRGYGTRPLSGYLAPDSNGNYTFLQTDFVRYDLQLNGDITVGKTTYKVADSYKPGCGANLSNSFHLVVVNRETLDVVTTHNTYCTAQADSEIARLAGDLSTLTNGFTNEGVLVFLASNGKPIPANRNFGLQGDPRVYPLAQQIAKLGGYWETMVYLSPNDTYSLVGAVAPPDGTKGAWKRAREASSVYPEVSAGRSPTGELHGVLSRGRGNFYSPLNADLSGSANLGLYEVLATPSAPFPHPAGDAEVAAFQSISTKLCGSGCNIRDLYDDLNVSFSNYQTQLQALADSSGRNCDVSGSNADVNFCTVRSQLLTEFAYVSNIRAFYTNVQSLWLGSGSVTILGQLNAYNTIKAQLNPPATTQSQSLTSPLVNFFLSLASFIPEVGPVFGLADVAFNFGTSLTTDQQGNKTIDLTSTIGDLQQQAIDQFTAQATTTGTLFQFLLQDWGKLSALGTALASAQNPSSPWYWSTTATSTILNQMTPAIRQAAYQNIMAAAYAIGAYLPDSGYSNGWGWGLYPVDAQPYAYRVIVDRRAPYTPLSSPFFTPNYIPYTYPGDPAWSPAPVPTSTLLSDSTWLGISALGTPWNGTTDDFEYTPPSEDVRNLLFKPVWNGGLGVYRPAFFHSWPFPRVTCTPSYGDRNGYSYSGGCNWSAASPAPEQLAGGRAVTSITMRAVVTSQQSPRPAQVDVMLAIHNNGTLTAQSIAIDSVTLRTLTGVGQATVVSPAVPIRLSNLRPGDSTSVFLKLNIPEGVTRISLTEQGTITSGNTQPPEVFRFNEAQALVLR